VPCHPKAFCNFTKQKEQKTIFNFQHEQLPAETEHKIENDIKEETLKYTCSSHCTSGTIGKSKRPITSQLCEKASTCSKPVQSLAILSNKRDKIIFNIPQEQVSHEIGH